jgi:hypothetical protein
MTGTEMPISFMAVDAYARRYGITGDAFDRLLLFVSTIDFAYLDVSAKAAAKRAGKQPTAEIEAQASAGGRQPQDQPRVNGNG